MGVDHRIRPPVAREPLPAVRGRERQRPARAAAGVVAVELDPDLVLPHVEPHGAAPSTGLRAVRGVAVQQRHPAVSRRRQVQLELADLGVQPARAAEVVEPGPGGLEGRGAVWPEAGDHHEVGDVLRDEAAHEEVDARRDGDAARLRGHRVGRSGRRVRGGLVVGPRPLVRGRDADREREVVLRDPHRIVLPQAELVAVVAEVLPLLVEDGPRHVAGGARHAVLARERGEGLGPHRGDDREEGDGCSDRSHRVILLRFTNRDFTYRVENGGSRSGMIPGRKEHSTVQEGIALHSTQMTIGRSHAP